MLLEAQVVWPRYPLVCCQLGTANNTSGCDILGLFYVPAPPKIGTGQCRISNLFDLKSSACGITSTRRSNRPSCSKDRWKIWREASERETRLEARLIIVPLRLRREKQRPVLSVTQLGGAEASSRGLILPATSPHTAHDPMAKTTARTTEDEGRAARDADRGRPQHAIRANAPAEGQERS
jgi:hypothetical protein